MKSANKNIDQTRALLIKPTTPKTQHDGIVADERPAVALRKDLAPEEKTFRGIMLALIIVSVASALGLLIDYFIEQ